MCGVSLILCLTAPLLFKEQIADWLDDGLPFADLAPDASRTSLDRIVDISRSRYPGEAMLSVFVDDDEPQIIVSLAESWEVFRNNNNARHIIKFDARTGQILKETKPYDGAAPPFLPVYNLHKELFAGLPGQLVVGIVGLAFVISVISGVILYAPFMRRLDFGRIRAATQFDWSGSIYTILSASSLRYGCASLGVPEFLMLCRRLCLATGKTPISRRS